MMSLHDISVEQPNQFAIDSPLWADFVKAKTANELCIAWLALVCADIPNAQIAAILVESQEAQTYVPIAVWPVATPNLSKLSTVVALSLRERRGVVQPAPKDNPADNATEHSTSNTINQQVIVETTHLAYPLMLEQRVIAVIAIEATCAKSEVDFIWRQLHWGSAWLTNLFAGKELEDAVKASARSASVLEVMAVALRHGKLQQALFEVVNDVRQRFDGDRVAIGLVNNASVKLAALSEAAIIEKHTSLAKAYVRVMEETHDYGKILQYDQAIRLNDFAQHYALAQISGVNHILSCPLHEGANIIGILVLERDNPSFSADDIIWIEAFATMVAPIISQRKKAERHIFLRLFDDSQSFLQKLFGPKHLVWKAIASLLILLILILSLVHINYRVTAKTVIEGETQRIVSAPFEGFVGASYVRAGDSVKQGQLLASLDERDLIIEQSRWLSERDQYENRLRESMATHDLVAVQVLSAQLSQAEAELNLVNQKIDHARLTAPFDGLVISGDLSQQVGAPVEVGKKLFEIAPLHSYRVILQVDEREIRHIKIGQLGQLVITGIAADSIPLTIQKVTPVATTQDGKNFFRVEASLSKASMRLRPGMEGVGKVVTGSRSLWWILMHSFTDWLRLTLWTWMP